ncbi:CPN2 family protein [Megaselia abdita]
MRLISKLVFVSFVLTKWKHFNVEHFLKDHCDIDNFIYPDSESKLRCYDINFTINQRFDIQSKHFIISNSSEVVFSNSEVNPMNDMFFEKFPEAWSMEFINSTLFLSSNSSNTENHPLETLVIKQSRIIKQDNPLSKSLINLEKLIIISSNFSDSSLDKNFLKFTTNLSRIYIISSNLWSIENGAFENLSKIEELTIARSFLIDLPDDIFINNKFLKRLDMSNDLFEEIPNVNYPESLEELKIAFNYLRKINRKDFKNLMNLKGLQLHGNFIEDFPIDTFWDMDFLEDLVLTKNNIQNISWKHFAFCDQLEWLDIQENFLKENALLGSHIANIRIKPQRQKSVIHRKVYEDFWLLFV